MKSKLTNSIQIQIDSDMEKLLVETVIDYFKLAEEARLKKDYGLDSKGGTLTFDTKLRLLKDVYYGKRQPKLVPWKNCSNRSMKIAMAIVEMLHARMFPAVWNEDLIRWRPGDKTDKDKVEKITKLMSWWVRVRTRMKDFFDRWCKVSLGFGDVVTECSWEIEYKDTGKFNETPITDEFGIQLYEKDGIPSVSREKIIRTEEKTKVEIIPKENIYFQEGQTNIQNDPVIIKCKWKYSELEQMEQGDKAVNVSIPLHENNQTLRDLISGQINGTYAYSTAENLEIIKEVKLRSTPVDVIKCYIKIDIDRDGLDEDIRIIVDPLRRIYLGGVAVKDISKRNIRPIDYTAINYYLETPDLLEGLGYIEIVLPLAEEIDAIFNQLTDANTLSVLRPGFYDPSGSLQPQNIILAPNKMIPVPDPQRNIYFPNIDIPTERLLVAMRAVLEFIERLTGASSYIMGKESEIVGGSGTATRTQAIVGAAEQRFSVPSERLRAGASRILTLILDQLQLNIPPGLENRILGEDNEPVFKSNELTDEGISGEYDAYLLEDVSMGSANTERQLAIFLYGTLIQNPLVASDPVKLYKETANLLKKHGEDPADHLGPEPDEKMTDTPEEENTLMVQGEFSKVRAQLTENHIQHISSHKLLLQSPTLAMLNPQMAESVISFDNTHIQEHMMMMQQMMAVMQKFGGQSGQSGTSGSNQANAAMQGVANMANPMQSVEARQAKGAAEFNPAM